jgi:hypothetical protein
MSNNNFDLDSIPKITEDPANVQPAPITFSPPYTNFSLKEKLRQKDGKIFGNFSSSFTETCISQIERFIEAGSVISMEEVGKCSGSGSVVVKFTHN